MSKVILALFVLLMLFAVPAVTLAEGEDDVAVEIVVDDDPAPVSSESDFSLISFWFASTFIALFTASAMSERFIDIAKTWIDAFINVVAGAIGNDDPYNKGLFQGRLARQIIIVAALLIASWQWVEADQLNLFTTAPDVITSNISDFWQNALTVGGYALLTITLHKQDFVSRLPFFS